MEQTKEARSYLKFVRISPRTVKIVLDLIRGTAGSRCCRCRQQLRNGYRQTVCVRVLCNSRHDAEKNDAQR